MMELNTTSGGTFKILKEFMTLVNKRGTGAALQISLDDALPPPPPSLFGVFAAAGGTDPVFGIGYSSGNNPYSGSNSQIVIGFKGPTNQLTIVNSSYNYTISSAAPAEGATCFRWCFPSLTSGGFFLDVPVDVYVTATPDSREIYITPPGVVPVPGSLFQYLIWQPNYPGGSNGAEYFTSITSYPLELTSTITLRGIIAIANNYAASSTFEYFAIRFMFLNRLP